MHPRIIDWSLIAYLSLGWGASFLLIALTLDSIPPVTLVSIRVIIGALVLLAIMRLQGLSFPEDKRWWGYFTILALIGNLMPFTLISWGQTQVTSSLAGILMALMPITTMLLAHFLVAGERMTLHRVIGFILGFLGVVVLVGGEALSGLGGATIIAQMAILLATSCYAINSIYAKRLPRINVVVAGAGTLLMGSIMVLPVALLLDRPWELEVTLQAGLAVTALGVFSTGLATWVFFLIIARRGPGFLAIINYIIPVIAFAAGVLLLNEPAGLNKIIALIMILSGIAIAQGVRRPPVRTQ
ncbi:DMT family transporter [Nitrincola alkalilacustris]|uniref:DMT family transporter n=1 Tax=Nitrincola alkalilacustris TaxID=1571224 RepID=UPI00124CE1B0|nr:DMT family transporter [Nitrincola alkalilacustris]